VSLVSFHQRTSIRSNRSGDSKRFQRSKRKKSAQGSHLTIDTLYLQPT
jgi:hypothetical protein